MRVPTSPASRDVLAGLYRWRYVTIVLLATGMWWMGNDRVVTWIVFAPFLIALVFVPTWVCGPRTLRRSFSEFKRGLRGDTSA